jgi:hypothetical protein
LFDEPEKALLVDHGKPAILGGTRGGAARQSVDQGHFAENADRRDAFDHRAREFDLDGAFDDGVEAVAGIARLKDGLVTKRTSGSRRSISKVGMGRDDPLRGRER